MERRSNRLPTRGKPGRNYLRNDLGLEPTLRAKGSPIKRPSVKGKTSPRQRKIYFFLAKVEYADPPPWFTESVPLPKFL
jgi:hypothetical protein